MNNKSALWLAGGVAATAGGVYFALQALFPERMERHPAKVQAAAGASAGHNESGLANAPESAPPGTNGLSEEQARRIGEEVGRRVAAEVAARVARQVVQDELRSRDLAQTPEESTAAAPAPPVPPPPPVPHRRKIVATAKSEAAAAPETHYPRKPTPPAADLITRWWGDSSGVFAVRYAGQIEGDRAVALLFSAPVNAGDLDSHVQVLDDNGSTVNGQWEKAPDNPRMALFKGVAPGRYTVVISQQLSDTQGHTLSADLHGPVYIR